MWCFYCAFCYEVCWFCGGASSSPPVCHRPSPQSKPPFLTALLSQCHPSSFHPTCPLEDVRRVQLYKIKLFELGLSKTQVFGIFTHLERSNSKATKRRTNSLLGCKPKCCCPKSLKGKRQNGEIAKLQGWTKLPIYMTYGSARINGDFFERALSSKGGNTHAAVLFYASWCPFSRDIYSTFEVLGSMYPQIDHLTVEQSSAMPSLFSRYGIHSLPAVLIVNHNSRTLFHGSKDRTPLSNFTRKRLDMNQFNTSLWISMAVWDVMESL